MKSHRPIALALVALLALLASGASPVEPLTNSNSNSYSDPSSLTYARRLRGSGTEYIWDAVVDSAGSLYVTGMTDSPNFPDTYGTCLNGSFDAFVVKLSPDGSRLEYATCLGGGALDQGSKIAVDEAGQATIVGYTFSPDFPTTPGAFDEVFNGGEIDAFVARLSPDGSAVLFSTYLGGGADDYAGGVAVDAAGSTYVTGYTESSDFPSTPGAYDTTFNGVADVMLVKLTADGSDLVYSTYLGGSAFESGYDLAVDQSGSAYLTGQTASTDFPTTPGVYDGLYNGGLGDAFAARLEPDGSALVYATFLGGSLFDDAKGIALSPGGSACVAGRTDSAGFPVTAGAYDTTYNGGRDAFALCLDSSSGLLTYATYLGGSGEEEAGSIAVDVNGNALIAGWTISTDFPTTVGAFDTSHNGDYDAFLSRLDPALASLSYSTFLGRRTSDYGRGLGVDTAGDAYLGGYTGFAFQDGLMVKLGLDDG